MDITSMLTGSPTRCGQPVARRGPFRPTNGDCHRKPEQDRARIQSQADRVSLPSIHQAFPEFNSESWTPARSPSVASLDRTQPRRPITPLEYSHRTPPPSHATPPSYSHGTTPDYSHGISPPYSHETPKDYSYGTSPDYCSPRPRWCDSEERSLDYSRRASQDYHDEASRDYSPRRSLEYTPPNSHRRNSLKRKRSTPEIGHSRQASQEPRSCEDRRPAGPSPQSPAHERGASTAWDIIRDRPVRRIISSVDQEQHEQHDKCRPTLPGFPTLDFEAGTQRNSRSHADGDFARIPRRHSGDHHDGYFLDAQGTRHWSAAPGFEYIARVQPMQADSARPSDSLPPYTPFVAYHQPRYMRMGGYGMTMNGDGKHRKRRGNLPKETTEKLRAWFVEHLQHPYPTEDEKQELMRITNLQMNQISNWFINARRRHLPALINSAIAESVATNGHGQVGNSRSRLRNGRGSDSDTRRKHSDSSATI